MATKQTNKFMSFIKKYKVLTITIGLFFIVLPLILIPTLYIYQVASSKHVIFHDKGNKALKINKQNYFDIDFSLNKIIESEEDVAGYYVFDYEIKVKDSVLNDINGITFNSQLSVINDDYTSYNEDSVSTLKSTTEYNMLKIPFDYNMDKRVLPLLYPKGPKLYLEISFTEYILNMPEQKTIYVEVPF